MQMSEIEKARHRREQEERERRRTEEIQKIHDLRMAEFKLIENGIKPLRFLSQAADVNHYQQLTRQIITADGEKVGTLSYKRNWSWKEGRYSVSSRRILKHGRYSWGEGQRFYKKLDSVVAAIKKFCIAVSDDEERAKVLRDEIQHYNEVLRGSHRRSRSVTGTYHGTLAVDGIIELLASDIGQDRIEGQEMIRVLVRKKRVSRRFHAWVLGNFIGPRQKELDSLDTSKEKVK
jgi:hypothetical protein